LEEDWKALNTVEKWLFYYIKGATSGVLVWIMRGILNLIVEGILDGMSFAYRSTREDGKVLLSFILKYILVLGYPIFILWGKKFIFKLENTDFETKYFILGYCTILYFVSIIIKLIWQANPLGSYMRLMSKMLKFNSSHQQQRMDKKQNDSTYRRGILHIKPVDEDNTRESRISPDHVEIEFQKPHYQNCESNSLYPELMVDFGLCLTFCTLIPIILFWNLFTVYLKTHQHLNHKFQSASTLETRRFDVPYIKQMFSIIFFVATLVNFYHFYEFYSNFSSYGLELIIGKTFLANNKFWILLICEHFILGLFIVVNMFGASRLNFVKMRRQTDNEKEYLERFKR
jgi:hypothetical protein